LEHHQIVANQQHNAMAWHAECHPGTNPGNAENARIDLKKTLKGK
jgi:hypothetical protein